MGDRGSIKVVCKNAWGKGKDDVSVTLFRHWAGSEECMIELCKKTKKEFVENRGAPPYNQVGEIIARMTKIAVEEDGSSSYLGKDESDGDDSDNGHYILYVSGFEKPDKWILTHEGKKIAEI